METGEKEKKAEQFSKLFRRGRSSSPHSSSLEADTALGGSVSLPPAPQGSASQLDNSSSSGQRDVGHDNPDVDHPPPLVPANFGAVSTQEATASRLADTPSKFRPKKFLHLGQSSSPRSSSLKVMLANTLSKAMPTKAQSRSPAYQEMESVCKGLTQLLRVIGPCLEGTLLKTPVAVLLAIADVVEGVKGVNEDSERILKSFASRLQVIENAFKDTENTDSKARIDAFVRLIILKAVDVKNIRKTSTWRKVRDTASLRGEATAIINELDRETTNFKLSVCLAIERDTKAVMEILLQNKLRGLRKVPEAFYNTDTVKGVPSRRACTEGTRVEVIERIIEWANDPHSPSIFWLCGMAGTGKSTIAFSICQHFDNVHDHKEPASHPNLCTSLGASFFCSRQTESLRQFKNITPTLVYQLARHLKSFASALRDVDEDVIFISGKHIKELLIAPWQRSAKDRQARELPPVLVVVDALDEIEEDGGQKFLRELISVMGNMSGHLHGLKVLVTSRPQPDIVNMTSQFLDSAVYDLVNIAEVDAHADVRKFFSKELSSIVGSPQLEQLVAHTNGLFIYAATMLRFIEPPQSKLVSSQVMDRVSKVLASHDAIPSAGGDVLIDTLYKQVVSAAIDAPPPEYHDIRLIILHAILLAYEPLTVSELSILVGQENDTGAVRIIVESLHAVLKLSKDHVYIYHTSFSDFLLNEQRCGSDFVCKNIQTHTAFLQGCLRVMSNSLHFNMCRLPSSYLLDSEVTSPALPERVEKYISSVSALEYACRYWNKHLIEGGKDGEHFNKELLHFVKKKGLFWIEVMNLLEIKRECLTTITIFQKWCKTSNIGQNLLNAMSTIERVATLFLKTPASLSTPHLYISALTTCVALDTTDSDKPRENFIGLPLMKCSGVNNHGGTLITITVESPVESVAFSPDGASIVSGSYNQTVRVWDVSTGKEKLTLRGHGNIVTSVAFSPDGASIVSGSWDKTVRVWDVSTGQEKLTLKGHNNSVTSVAFSPDGASIVSGSDDATVRVWDVITGQEKLTLRGHDSWVTSVAFSPDGASIVSGSWDKTVRVWDVSTGKEKLTLKGHNNSVTSVAFSLDGTSIVSGSHDKTVCVWDVSTGQKILTLRGHDNGVTSVAFSPDGTSIASGSGDETVCVWDVPTGQKKLTLRGHNGGVSSVAFSPDGASIVSGSYDRTVPIWDVSTGQEKLTLRGHDNLVTSVAFSPDGASIVSGSFDRTVCVWDVSTGQEKVTLRGHDSWVTSVAFSPDGASIVSGSRDKTVRVWDVSTGQEKFTLRGHDSWVTSVTFSPDGASIVSGSDDKTVRVWDVSTGQEKLTLRGHDNSVTSVAFSPDGASIVSGLWDETVCVWDVSTGQKKLTLRGHDNPVSSVAISPNGAFIVSGSDDKTVRVWDMSTGQEKFTLRGHENSVTSVVFSPNGSFIASGSLDNSVRIWNFSTQLGGQSPGWTLQPSGWVMTAQNDRLMWLPKYLHTGLLNWPCQTVISSQGFTSLEFSGANIGTNWAACYQPSEL